MGSQSPLPESFNSQSLAKARLDQNGEDNLGSYGAWLVNHPSALDAFESMMDSTEGKTLIVFLDYDGTLSPIVDDPEKAFMSDKMRAAVEDVANVFPTAIVSGRCRNKVKGFVKLQNVTYAGSHGMDIQTTTGSLNGKFDHQSRAVDEKGNEVICFEPAKDFLPTIQKILKTLEEQTKTIDGVIIEDNKFCVSVHFRCVKVENVDALKEKVKSIMEAYPNFRISGGRKVMEIRPRIDWDKGRALQYILQSLGTGDSDEFIPMYLGDDKTDEDAFKVINDIGRGYPIIVSSIPKETNASYSLRDTDEVMSFLIHLAEWKKGISSQN